MTYEILIETIRIKYKKGWTKQYNTKPITVTDTLERIEDSENVVSRHPEDTMAEEDKTPWDTQNGTQSHDDDNVFATSVSLCNGCLMSLLTKEPRQYEDEGREGDQEDQRIVAYVDN